MKTKTIGKDKGALAYAFTLKKGSLLQGIGIAPHVYSKNQKSDVLAGVDKTLELAISN